MRDLLSVQLNEGHAKVVCGAASYDEILTTLGVVCQHLLTMVDDEHAAKLVADMHIVIDEAQQRGMVGRLSVVPDSD